MTQKSGKKGEQDERRIVSRADHHPSQQRVVDVCKVRSLCSGDRVVPARQVS